MSSAAAASVAVLVLGVVSAGGCGPTITGLEVEASFDPALAVDQLRFALSAEGAAAVDPVLAPAARKILTSGDESAGFIVPDDMVDRDVVVDVVGLAAGRTVAHGSAHATAARGRITAVSVALTAVDGAGVCGDGAVDAGEACDDDNTDDGDGCSAACAVELGFACSGAPSVCQQCGDGVVQGDEGCDDANFTAGDGCSDCVVDHGFVCNNAVSPSACSSACGDGVVGGVEQCDDHDNDDGDGCSAACGLELGFACTGAPSACAPVCGDGIILPGEACDDGDGDGGDGCSAGCTLEQGFDCAGEPSVCVAVCGDGLVRGDEECDDGDGANSDTAPNACRTDCTSARCGDGVTDDALGEQCDDQNTDDGDGCLTGCRAPACGDGLRQGAEECDDGNTDDGDGCTAGCTIDPLFRCGGEPSVCAPLSCAAHPCAHVVAAAGGGEFTSVSGALGAAAVASGDVLFLQPGTYAEHFTLASKDIVLVGDGAPASVIIAADANNSDTIHVASGRALTLQGIKIVNQRNGGNRDGLELDGGARAVLSRCTIGPSNGRGVVTAAGSTLTVTRSIVTAGDGGGLVLAGDFVVENTAIFANAGAGAALSHAGVFRFDLVRDNGAAGVQCSGAGAGVNVQGSIVFDNALSGCGDAGDNVLDGAAAALDVDGVHVRGASAAIDRAGAACPAVDLDGNPRPINGACDAGVDERPR